MKGNQNNLDQRKEILDIKDRSILCPQSSSFWLSRHCLLQSRYLRTTWIATAIESDTKVCTMFGGRRGGWTLRRVGWGLGQRRLCLLFWCCYLLKLLQLQQQCRAISNWWLQSISNKIFKNAFLLLYHQHSSCPCWPWIISPKWWETATKEVINQIICTNFHIFFIFFPWRNSLFQTETDVSGTIMNYGLWTTFFIWN